MSDKITYIFVAHKASAKVLERNLGSLSVDNEIYHSMKKSFLEYEKDNQIYATYMDINSGSIYLEE